MKPILPLTLVVVLTLLSLSAAHAEWQLDGNLVSIGDGPYLTSMISDGAGGAIFAWADFRNGLDYDIYVQRIDPNGLTLWTPGGVLLCAAIGEQAAPVLVSDGAGGAIATWEDIRSGARDIYARRVTSAGVPQWTADGVALCTATNHQFLPLIASDGAGGAIVTWRDLRSGTSYDIYARRVTSAGAAQWTANGAPVCVAALHQVSPVPVADGSGGAIIAWVDSRSGNSDIYVQRLNSAGAAQWTLDGVALCAAVNSQLGAAPVSDGAGGAIVAWWDLRNGANYDIYARRVNSAGAPQWQVDGTAVSVAAGSQENPSIISDGVGGAIITWHDHRGTDFDIYAQRMTGAGVPLWATDGIAVCAAFDDQGTASIASDGASGAIIAWSDARFGNDDIYARRILASGQRIWTVDGSALCNAALDQSTPIVVSDGAGGALVGWNDSRSYSQIYMQRAEPRYGTWGRPEPTIVSATDNPNDEGGAVILRWIASEHDRFYYPGISHYSVWRTTDAIAMMASAPNVTVVTNPAEIGEDFAGSAIYEESTPAGPLYWEWVANQSAFYSQSYSYLTPTRADSTVGVPATHHFKVIAHEADFPQTRAWESGTVSGNSYDNLAPPPPIALGGTPSPWDITLNWTSGGIVEDFDHYQIYRRSNPSVLPVPLYLIGTSDEIVFVDDSVPGGPLYYIVTAVDIHGNQSAPSNVWSPPGTTPVGDTPSISKLTVLDNIPNPFSASTRIRVGLPKASDMEIEVFDVAGRRVRSERMATVAAGWRDVSFDARDTSGRALPSGVYFYRVKAAGETITRKIVIAR